MDKKTSENRLNKIAQDIYNLDIYGFRDADATPETITEALQDPAGMLDAIEFLLEIIEG